MGDGLTEDDLLGGAPREPLRTACLGLVEKLWAQLVGAGDLVNLPAVRSAVQEVQHAANTDAAARLRLDSALGELVRAIDGGDSHTMSRLDAVEDLVGAAQAVAMARLAPAAAGDTAEAAEAAEMEVDDPTTLALSTALQNFAQTVGVDPREYPSAVEAAAAVEVAVQALVERLPPAFFEPVVPPGSLSDAQEAQLGEVATALHAETALRRRMLIERVKVTLKSFMWSPRLGEGAERAAAEAAMEAGLAEMAPEPHVTLEDVFTANLGDLMGITERATSSGSGGGAKARVKEVLIGAVPDRGGRTEGRRKVDMPEWSERKVTAGGRGGRGGGRGGRGGGGVRQNKKQKA